MTAPKSSKADCKALLLQVSQYLDGDLTPARLRRVEQHIKECACCGTLAARLQKTLAVCRAEGKTRPPRAVMARAAARIRLLIARKARPAARPPSKA